MRLEHLCEDRLVLSYRVVIEGGHRLTKLNGLFVRVAVIVASALRMLVCMAMRVVKPYRILWTNSWSQAANHTSHTIRDAAQDRFPLSSVGSRWGSTVPVMPAARVMFVCVCVVPVVVCLSTRRRGTSLFLCLFLCNLLQHLEILVGINSIPSIPSPAKLQSSTRSLSVEIQPRHRLHRADFDEAPTPLQASW